MTIWLRTVGLQRCGEDGGGVGASSVYLSSWVVMVVAAGSVFTF
jgi:hypothetical protein